MRLQQLFEDIDSDQKKLSNAREAFDNFMIEFKGHIELLGLDEFDYFEKSYLDILRKLYKYTFKLTYKDNPLGVRVLPRNQLTKNTIGKLITTSINDGYTTTFKYEIHLYINENNDEDLISINDFYKMFTNMYKKVFVHEYVHFMDSVDSDNEEMYIDTKRKLRQSGKYIDTPHEYNAFYIQIMHEIEHVFEDPSVMSIFSKNPSFDNFISLIRVETHGGEMLSDLKGKYDKAFKKRLYQLYKTYLEKINRE